MGAYNVISNPGFNLKHWTFKGSISRSCLKPAGVIGYVMGELQSVPAEP